jgi:cellulose synthase/poly-beta-1,6-N-acetylglucosamine synthase-like glycosyltransferase
MFNLMLIDKMGLVIMSLLWLLMFAFTLAPHLVALNISQNNKINLSFVTTPLVAISILNSSVWLSVYIVFHFVVGKVVNYQKELLHNYGSKNHPFEPLVSILIPARNEDNVIRKTILNCLQQTYNNIEIIVICHNSTDKTYEETNGIDDRVKPFNLKTIEFGKGIALNYGIDQCNGEYICIIDSDGKIEKDFVSNTLPFFDEEYVAVQGKIDASNREFNLLSRLLALEGDLFSFPFMVFRSFLNKKTPLGGTGFIIKRDVLLKVGKFTNSLIDDFELSFRLYKNKYKVAFAPLSVVYDEKPATYNMMMNQRARWIKGHLDLLKHMIVEPTDILGIVYWLTPVFSITGLISICIASFAIIFFLCFGYYPYLFAHTPFLTWAILLFATNIMYISLLRYNKDIRNFRNGLYSLLLTPFSNYWYVVLIRAFFVKGWATTKTTHGFESVQT